MLKFEYMFAELQWNARHERLADQLNELGAEGWEVIDFVRDTSAVARVLLKREIEDETTKLEAQSLVASATDPNGPRWGDPGYTREEKTDG